MNWKGIASLAGAVVLWLGLFVFCRVEGSFLSWFLLYFYTALCLYEILVWTLSLRNTDVRRTLSATRLSEGQALTVRVLVLRRNWWPVLWLQVVEDFPSAWSVHSEETHRIVQPLWNSRVELSYRVYALKRGVYELGKTTLETGDVFGLQRRRLGFREHAEVIVYPKVVPVRGWSGWSRDDASVRRPTSRITEESSNVMGVRDYIAGDKLSRIHWMASARRGSLLSKEFELHVSHDLIFLADLSHASHKDLQDGVFELEMVTTASLMKFCFESHRHFGLILHGKTLQQFPAGVGEALFFHCMEALAMAQTDGPVPFFESLVRSVQEVQHGGTLVVVSPKVDRNSAIAVETISKRVGVEWFVPLVDSNLNASQRAAVAMMQNAGTKVRLISAPARLSQLNQGGARFATHSE